MRDRSSWHIRLLPQLKDVWPSRTHGFSPGDLLDTELGLYLLETVMPTRTAGDAWTLLGGYPYGEAFGDTQTPEQRLRVMRARHYLWDMRRRREWQRAVQEYQAIPEELRGYDVKALSAVPVRRSPSRAAGRFTAYEELLTSPPAFTRRNLPAAGPGDWQFGVRDRRYSVTFTTELLDAPAPQQHDLSALPPGRGEPIAVTWDQLRAAAEAMDAREAADGGRRAGQWARRLADVRLLLRDDAKGSFEPGQTLCIDGLLHLVGMVGAGKSTLRDILAFWCATQAGRQVTIIVGDVAETLAITDRFARLGVSAAPILGTSTRERNIERLHRRTATAGAPTMLAHDHPGFAYLSSACPVDALRGLEAARPLRIGEAPCQALYPPPRTARGSSPLMPGSQPDDSPVKPRHADRLHAHGCPLWSRCPRHHAARELVRAQIWVATPASLVHSAVPAHLHAERLRYLELACRRSDLIIVDEADRVQMQLDTAFAPATTLSGRSPNSWLDEVAGHKVTELAREGRLQLSNMDVDDWTSAVNTVSAANDRLYSQLIGNPALRTWIVEDYFSALTLHQLLISDWFPELAAEPPADAEPHAAARQERERARDRASRILDRFRDNPLQAQAGPDEDAGETDTVNALVHLTLELLQAPPDNATRERIRQAVLQLAGDNQHITADLDTQTTRFEFTLVLAALHHRLNHMTTLWQRVEAALNLESTSNVLSRRPPRDYEPVIPESPMGNVLGFQFQPGETSRDGHQSGELRFFRCSGVGRELLLALPDLPAVDDRPGPHLLLMSATSWAGTSSRYHIQAPVGAVLQPQDRHVSAIKRTEFRTQFLYWPGTTTPLRLSGCPPGMRPQALLQMLRQLAVPDRSLAGSVSLLDLELAEIADPERRRILLLVGSYAEASHAAAFLGSIPEWQGRVTLLVSDDSDLDDSWAAMAGDPTTQLLSRGDIASFPDRGGEVLIAPLLAVERGHNIVLPGGKAAIGTVYFLARPHPRPDDITLAVQAINDWAVRQLRGPGFRQAALAAGTPDLAAVEFRRRARATWSRLLTRQLSWTSLPAEEKASFTWDQLVVIWQVIGRLVRGGVPARAVFVDAAFSPRAAGDSGTDTPATSLLVSMREVLAPYFSGGTTAPSIDCSLVQALYEPLYLALADLT